MHTKSYKCFSCNYNATHFCLIGGSIRRQIANPTRPTRTLTSFTRGVRRGDWFSSTSTQEFPLNYCVHPVITLTIMLQVEKTKALMPMEIRLTSQQSCSILHGTQLRIPSHVLLQIACICIMRRECPTENLLFFFWLAPHEGPGLSTATREMVQDVVISSALGGQKRLLISTRSPCCYAEVHAALLIL